MEKEKKAQVDAILKANEGSPQHLLKILAAVQEIYKYLPEDVM